MADWRKRALITRDVVSFQYVEPQKAKEPKHVYVWDLDKTYLDTHFGSLKELWRTIREKALQKKNIPGTRELLRSLVKEQSIGEQNFSVYFISASPPQLEEKIKTKLEFDGILPHGAFFKDNLKNLKPSRLWRLTQHVGYKLQALLQLKLRLHEDVQQTLWGDDSESDAVIYSLYSDICSHRVEDKELKSILTSYNVLPPQIDYILSLQKQIKPCDPVHKVYINLISDTDPDYYVKFGRRVVPSYNSFQMSLDIFQDALISAETLKNIASDLIKNYDFSIDELEWSVEELALRRILSQQTVDIVVPLLKDANLVASRFKLTEKAKSALGEGPNMLNWVPQKVDYLNDYR